MLLTFFLLQNQAWAQSKDYPSTIKIWSVDGFSVMNGGCKKLSSNSIECQFYQLNFSVDDENHIAKEIAYQRESLQKQPLPSPAELKKQFQICGNGKNFTDYIIDEKPPIEKEKVLNAQVAEIENMCKCQSAADPWSCLQANSIRKIKESLNTCRLSPFGREIFSLKFKRVGDKWVSNSGPQGLCDVIKVITLEKESEKYGWEILTFTQVVVSSGKGSLCPTKSDLFKPLVFSWKYGALAELTCSRFSFR
jgi:hypothetical protein